MAGLYSALNIAKNSLLAFQTAVHVTGHNVANVDSEGYSRQKVVNAPYPPTPGPAGPMGSGVKVEQIKRYFDAFLEANINLKRSDLGLLSAEETGIDLIQSLFNETNPLGLSRMIGDFFTSWQGLSNRAEGIPERRVVIEKGQVLAEAVRDKYQAIVDLENNVRLKLRDVVGEINELAKQIAEINRQITAAESGLHQANDLRDQRDRLIVRLSELAQIRYFENSQGAYAVILGNGYNLVDIDSYWELDLSGGEVYWQGHSGEKVRLTSQEVSRGKLGGWLRIIEQISEDWNHEYVVSTRNAFTRDGRIIQENTTWKELGISGSVTIGFRGTNHFGEEITGSYTTSEETKTIRDFLDEIEKAFDYQVEAYLTEDGRLVVKDAYRGGGMLSFEITSGPLDLGRFDDEAANHRVEELNLTGKFQLFAEELIRAVNEIHTEGVGLEFYEGELEGIYHSDGTLKGFPFFRELKRDGSFFLWVKAPSGEITPVKVDFALPADAELEDVASRINTALSDLGFTPEESVKALVRGGRLVFQAQEGYGFAFSNDTANILLVTGVNVFFAGHDAGSIAINKQLSVDPKYLAAARLDREAWRSEASISGTYRSRDTVDPNKVFNDPSHKIYVRFFDSRGTFLEEQDITVPSGATLAEIIQELDRLEGFRAYLDSDNHLILRLDPNTSHPYAYFELGVDDPENQGTFLAYLKEKGLWAPQYHRDPSNPAGGSQIFSGLEPIIKPRQYLGNIGSVDPSTLSFSGELTIRFFDSEGSEIAAETFSGANLEALISDLDDDSRLRAYIDNGEVVIGLENPDISYFIIEEDDQAESWGRIFLENGGSPFELHFEIGSLAHWLFDEKGNPIDTDPENEVVDPFQLSLDTRGGVIQILQGYNDEKNARYGLKAALDSEGRLTVSISGLYETKSFVVTDVLPKNSFETNYLVAGELEIDNGRKFLITSLAVKEDDKFSDQSITISYLKKDGTSLKSETISISDGDTLSDFLASLNNLDTDGDGNKDFRAFIDKSNRLQIYINDPDVNNDGKADFISFKIETDLSSEEGNLVTYLSRRILFQKKGFSDLVQGFAPQPADNRNALRLATLSDERREALGGASVSDYYSSFVGEVGIAAKTVKNSKTFMEDLINQLQVMRDSISAVSLDEEMANLIKYQQAFAASAKILTVADEMLDTLIAAKR